MFNGLRRSKNDEEINTKDDPLTSLSKGIKKKMVKRILYTAADLIALASTPLIVNHVLENIDDEYAKKVIGIGGATIAAYQTNTIFNDVHELRSSIHAYKESVKMANTAFDEVPLDNVMIIELESDQWTVSAESPINNIEKTIDDETTIVKSIDNVYVEDNHSKFQMILNDNVIDDEEDDASGEVLYFIRVGEDEPDIDDLE